MALSRRERRHEQTRQEIKHIARQQMAQQGTASLSLRGIAAEMGMSAPSLYNYYTSRDDLVTDLLVDSYTHQLATWQIRTAPIERSWWSIPFAPTSCKRQAHESH